MAVRRGRIYLRNSYYGLKGELPETPPPAGTYPWFGMSSNSQDDFDTKMAQMGGLAADRHFMSAGDGVPLWDRGLLGHKVSRLAAGAALIVSHKDGSLDTITASMRAAPKHLQTFWVRRHEPEDETPDSLDPNTPFKVQWRAEQQDLRRAWVAAGQPAHIRIGPCLMGFSFRTPKRNPADWWPEPVSIGGRTYQTADCLLVDQYDPGFKSGTYSNFANLNVEVRKFAADRGVPLGFAELGSAVGLSRPTELDKRRSWIKGAGDYCVANGGSGPGQVIVVTYWDVKAVKSWSTAEPQYAQYGRIPKADYRLDLDPPILAEAPGSLAGQIAHGGPDPQSVPMWRALVAASRAAHGITYPSS